MLNKEICKRCINGREDVVCWDDYDEYNWNEKGFVACKPGFLLYSPDIHTIPSYCFKYMEQVILQNDDKH